MHKLSLQTKANLFFGDVYTYIQDKRIAFLMMDPDLLFLWFGRHTG